MIWLGWFGLCVICSWLLGLLASLFNSVVVLTRSGVSFYVVWTVVDAMWGCLVVRCVCLVGLVFV